MESKSINFLPKQEINVQNLNYIMNTKDVYANLYEIKIKKELKLYQYPYKVSPPIGDTDIRIREKLFKIANRKLKNIFDECFI